MSYIRRSASAPLLLLLVTALLLAACVTPGGTPADGAAAGSSSDNVTVVYWAHNFEPRVELDKKYIAQFMEENPGITVEYEVVPADFDAKLRTALASGQGPDLFAQWNGDIGTFFAEGIGLAKRADGSICRPR